MEAKYSAESKSSGFKSTSGSKGNKGEEDEEIFYSDDKDVGDRAEDKDHFPQVNILEVDIRPNKVVEVTAGLSLKIKFELSKDAVAAFWSIRFLVDSAHNRIIQMLGQTEIEDYPDGESEMEFKIDSINIDNIPPSTLTNAGLLMAVLMVEDEEVATVNMVSFILIL
jgi:allophanate hydrolase subunit 2